MTSLVSRKLHMLMPRITRVGTTRSGMGKLRISTTTVTQKNFTMIMLGDLNLYASTRSIHNPAYVPVEVEGGGEPEKRKRVTMKSKEEDLLDRMLYKLDLDVRRTGRALSIELEKAAKMIERSGSCTANQALLVLRCCGEVLVDIDKENRTKLLERYLAIIKKSGVQLEISHYNAILRVHLENQKEVSAPEFVADMEAADIAPNRVTFQHLVGLYCMKGNITGATTILEHMKSQNMPINEAIFISLLKGHCANNDTESVSGTLDVMTSSGLSIGADAFTAMASSYGKAGNWAKVEEVLSKAEDEDIKLDDGDIFSIMLACSQGGLNKEVEGLVTKLPRKRGFFQEMRNHLPQLAMSGDVETAVEIYLSLEDREGGGREQMGLFVVAPLVKSGESVEVVLKAVLKMKEAGYINALHYLIQEAAYHWSNEKCMELIESIKTDMDKDDNIVMNTDLAVRSLKAAMHQEGNLEKTMAAMSNMHAMGINVPFAFIQNSLIPAMLDLDQELPAQTARRLRNGCPFMSREITDALVLHSLYFKEDIKALRAATGFLLNVVGGYSYPSRWNLPMAKAYLKTNSLEDLITSVFVNSRERALGKDHDQAADQLFKVLEYILEHTPYYYPDSEPESMLNPVLEEIVRLHIGVPRKVVMALKEDVKNEQTLDLLDKAEIQWNNRKAYWTVGTINDCYNDRRILHSNSKNVSSDRYTDLRDIKRRYRGNFKIPETLEEMEEIHEILSSRDDVNFALSNSLTQAYASSGMIDKALKLIKYSQSKRDKYNLAPTAHDAVAKSLVEHGRVQEAIDLMEHQMKRNGNHTFISTFMTCLEGLADEGKDHLLLDMIDKCDTSKFLSNRSNVNSVRVTTAYSQKGNVKMVQEVFNALFTNKLTSPDNVVNLIPLVEVHLVNDDLNSAISEFKRLAKLYKRLPKKFELTCRLIEEDQVEVLQEILDISIAVVGEASSLYDLAFCYLVMGRTDQAKNLYRTPGLIYDERLLEFQCYKLRNDKNWEALEDLVAYSKHINGCDRNIPYQHLVCSFKEDADKVSDIWLQVQEEGFPPSDGLKMEIAKALKAAGKTAPFEEPVEYINVSRSENDLKAKRKSLGCPKVDEDVYKALEVKDFNTVRQLVMDSFEKENTSLKCKKDAINTLLKEERLEEAAELAIRLAQWYRDPRKIQFKGLYNNILKKLGPTEKENFLNSLQPALVKKLKISENSNQESPK